MREKKLLIVYNLKKMKNNCRVYCCLILIPFACVCVAENSRYDSLSLSRELDSALSLDLPQKRLAIYTNILEHVPSNTLVSTHYDGADALFEALAGTAWAYLHIYDSDILTGVEYALRAREYGYTIGVPASNPEKFADHLHILALYYENKLISDSEQRANYYEEAWEHWPYYTLSMQNAWYRRCALVHYKPEKAVLITEELIENAPFSSMYYYANGGWYYILLERYRDAFRIWLKGLQDSEIQYHNSIIEVCRRYIEYATLDELKKMQQLMRANAAKQPASISTTDNVIKWLQNSEDAHLLFEIELRTAETNGDTATVKRMLHNAVTMYRRPLYAEKLGDTNAVVQLYCDRMKQEIWWWKYLSYSLLPKVQALLETGDCTEATKEYFLLTLMKLKEKYPKALILDEYLEKARAIR